AVEMITPTDEHFPEAYTGCDDDIERIFAFVCRQMDVPRETVDLALFEGEERPRFLDDGRSSPVGLYQLPGDNAARQTVWIKRSQCADPLHLIATAAHELAHCILLGNGLLTSAEADHEFVTDLLIVARGLGIFAANAVIHEESKQLGLTYSWSVGKVGYLPPRMYGYALSVFAWLRGDNAAWARHLRSDPHSVFNAGLAYLQRTDDCLCGSTSRAARHLGDRLVARLSSDNPGVRLAALWELRRPEPPPLPAEACAALRDCLDHRDSIVVAEAALAIAALDLLDAHVAESCRDLLMGSGHDPDALSALALALGVQKEILDADSKLMETSAEALLKLLEHPSPRVVLGSLTALKQLAPPCDFFALRQLMQVFRKGLVECDNLLIMHTVETLRAVCESPQEALEASFSDDPALHNQALSALTSEFDAAELQTTRLPTQTSLPVPLPDWRPDGPRLKGGSGYVP
ncbi:MAG: hypothetical protein HY290_23855, partial [Planctomycetia bacterium]|nr:hypothetical protein [Planctomycetia bacterium]